ncbi:MAG: cupin domain-containing protein [Anaerolineae bacterium]|nr:cupin domain-containing protein [Anaerolineae bacterium]
MITANLNNLELQETWTENDATQRARSTFPLAGALGTENSTLVYFELAPGDHLGRHTDSAEEVLFIVAGTVEVTVGDERGQIAQGQLAIVPTMVPHDLRNVGQDTAKVAGFFGSPKLVATFDNAWQPFNSHVVDTEVVFAQPA